MGYTYDVNLVKNVLTKKKQFRAFSICENNGKQ